MMQINGSVVLTGDVVRKSPARRRPYARGWCAMQLQASPLQEDISAVGAPIAWEAQVRWAASRPPIINPVIRPAATPAPPPP